MNNLVDLGVEVGVKTLYTLIYGERIQARPLCLVGIEAFEIKNVRFSLMRLR